MKVGGSIRRSKEIFMIEINRTLAVATNGTSAKKICYVSFCSGATHVQTYCCQFHSKLACFGMQPGAGCGGVWGWLDVGLFKGDVTQDLLLVYALLAILDRQKNMDPTMFPMGMV
jgi:hypothetical protein